MKTIILLLFTTVLFSQESIVASGTNDYTIGETFPIMQQVQKAEEVTLVVPKFEIPIETPKPIIKKKSFIQKIIEFFKNLIKS